MTLATEVKRLAESKPFYAVAGAGDYAVEKLRELPEHLQRIQGRREDIRDAAREAAKDLPEKAKELADKAEVYAREFPGKARGYADQVSGRAVKLYEEFATRGRKVVSKTSGQTARELAQVSEAAKPARKSTRTTRNGSSAKS
ncbi:hypothetical protein ACFY19_28670 [Streptosporangium saharense]|uniref:Gas vesicle protein n=1 Tax=Streptosporangium saharense TaxID=1706840 RepID=A0A7W7QHN3_9ACTN|nr:hypothetical protein [Streptosporangium saharense]MBB4913777.1 gas vesicle protein [Streptosporangium saharense]